MKTSIPLMKLGLASAIAEFFKVVVVFNVTPPRILSQD